MPDRFSQRAKSEEQMFPGQRDNDRAVDVNMLKLKPHRAHITLPSLYITERSRNKANCTLRSLAQLRLASHRRPTQINNRRAAKSTNKRTSARVTSTEPQAGKNPVFTETRDEHRRHRQTASTRLWNRGVGSTSPACVLLWERKKKKKGRSIFRCPTGQRTGASWAADADAKTFMNANGTGLC